MAASILTGEETRLEECPELVDVAYMADILRTLGCRIHSGDGALTIDPQNLNRHEMPDALAKKIRSSIFLLGSILARFRRATVTFPGGCEIGLRPIDLHLSGLRQLGVDVREEGGLIRCDGRHMRAGTVHFDYPSVGATENVMMAAALLKGRTVLSNVAREPEITDLQNFLNAMGARISGAGTHTVTVEGVDRLRGVSYCPMPDRIVAGTLLAAAAATGGDIRLTNVPCRDLYAVFTKMREMGCRSTRRKARCGFARRSDSRLSSSCRRSRIRVFPRICRPRCWPWPRWRREPRWWWRTYLRTALRTRAISTAWVPMCW